MNRMWARLHDHVNQPRVISMVSRRGFTFGNTYKFIVLIMRSLSVVDMNFRQLGCDLVHKFPPSGARR